MNKKLGLFLLLLGAIQFHAVGQRTAKVPQDLCGYWQNELKNANDWTGPVITPDYVNFFYRIYYTDSIAKPVAGRTVLFLHDNDGNERQLRIDRLGTDSVSYTFTGWNASRTAVRRPQHSLMQTVPAGQLPAALYKRWVTGRGAEGCVFDPSGRVRFDDAEWRIAGVRRITPYDGYEILLNDASRYRLLYIREVTPSFLHFGCEMRIYKMVPAASDTAIYRLQGTWTDPETNVWTYGFFENFAVYDQACWEYESVRLKKNKGEIVLKKGNERLNLNVSWQARNDSVCTIAPAGGKKRTYIRYTQAPDYPAPDTTSFLDTHYRPDSVTVAGYFRGVDLRQPFELAINNFLTDREEIFYADFDSLGRFRLTVPVLNTSECYVDWRRARLHMALEPGETLFIYGDFTTGEVRFMGRNARFHQEMDRFFRSPEYKQQRYFLPNDAWPGDHDRYFREQLKVYHSQTAFLQKYLSEHPTVSEKFRQFQRAYIAGEWGYGLMQRRFKLDRNGKERFSAAYMACADSLFAALPRPYTLVRSICAFTRDYQGYYNEIKNGAISIDFPIFEALKQLNKEGRFPLTEAQRADLATLEQAAALSLYLTWVEKLDSAAVAERIKPYEAAGQRMKPVLEDSVLTNYLANEWPAVSDRVVALNNLKKEMYLLDSLRIDPELRELVLTRLYVKRFYDVRKVQPDARIDAFQEQVRNPYLLERVLGLQAYYADLEHQDIKYVESLKKTDHLRDSKDADELFARLIEPYRGKVIYIDFWGTWCGPCKEEMSYVGKVKEALKDRDVIFMYFANRSPEDSWKNVIRAYHLTGPNIVHYNLPDEQERMLERRFSVSGFPTFILIDRKGNVVNMNPPRPRQTTALIDAIVRLLDEE